MAPNYGSPITLAPEPTKTAVLRTVALGFSFGAEAPQLPPGVSSHGSNFIAVRGGLTPRPNLQTAFGTSIVTSSVISHPAGWVGEYYDSTGNRFPVALSSQYPAYYSNGSWSTLSQTGPAGLSGNTLTTAYGNYDAVVYFHPTSDKYELCFINDQGNNAYTWKQSDGRLFSTLTNAPAGRYVTAFDNRLIFGFASGFPQRVAWSARGDPETYTTPDGGFEEILDMNGPIVRVINADDRILVFSEREVWQGLKVAFPFNFEFVPIDRTVGCVAGKTVTKTPYGIMFLGSDSNVYLIPPGGTPQAVGGDVQKMLIDGVVPSAITSSSAVWMNDPGAYFLTYRSGGQSVNSQRQHGVIGVLDAAQRRVSWNPIAFADQVIWGIKALGATSYRTIVDLLGSTVDGIGAQRILVADYGQTASGVTFGGVLEFTSGATNDYKNLDPSIANTDCRYQFIVGNPDPTTKQHIREFRLDYRCASASSLSIRMTPDFGSTYPVETAVALPAAPFSAQTKIGVLGVPAVYPGVEFRHASGHSFVLQGAMALVESVGNG